MKKFNKKPLASFLGYLLVTGSSLAMNSEDDYSKYRNYEPLHPNRSNASATLYQYHVGNMLQEDSSSTSSSTSSSDPAEDLLPSLPSGPGDLYSLPYNKILNNLAEWPGDVTGSVDCWMAQVGSSEFSWVPGTMTIQRHRILWTPVSKSMATDAIAGPILKQPLYTPRSFSHARKVRTESETEFKLLARITGNDLKESRKGSLKESRKETQLGDRFRVSGSVEPWIEAINNYITQVSDWEKLYQLGSDFISKATTFGRMIIEEYHLPDAKKAIKKSSLGGVAGGEKFIIHDILFKFSIDPEINSNRWLYGGNKADDTKAFKSFNHELLGANAVSSYGVWLKTPLMAFIDFRGRRLMATSLIPINNDTLVYGSKDGAKTVFATDPLANEKMTQMGKDFNLQPHMVTNKLMALCGDLEIHHSWGDYYALDLARIFPPEDPSIQKLPLVSVFYQKLNPIFVKAYKTPLDADGFTRFQEGSEDAEANNANLTLATQYLYDQVLPRFVEALMTLPIPEFLLEKEKKSRTGHDKGEDFLITSLHEAGLNVRHLGRVWEALEEAHKKSLTEKSRPQKSLTPTSLAKESIDPEKIRAMSDYALNVMVTRVLKNHVRTVFREEMTQENEYQYFITDIMNKLTYSTPEMRLFWAAQMPKILKDQFGIETSGLIDRLHQGYLLTTFSDLMGIVVRNHPVYEKTMSFEFAPSDIVDFRPMIKYLNMIDLATGMNHYFKGIALLPKAKDANSSSQISRIGLDHLIKARDKLISCSKTWNNQNHEALPYHLDKLVNTLQELIQEHSLHVGLEASLRDNLLQSMISGDGYIDAVNLREFWTSGSKKFTQIKVRGTLPDLALYDVMLLPTNLTHIDVSQCSGITPGAQKIVQLFFESLKLRMPELPPSETQVEEAKGSTLTSVDLKNCRLGAAGARVLNLVLPQNNNITSLNLCGSDMGNEGANALSTGQLMGLTSLNLGINKIGDEGAKALSTGNFTALTSLSLGNNVIGDEGAKALSIGNLTNLTELNLGNNVIGDEGAKALSSANLTSLTSLNLYNNRIKAVGTKALSTGNLMGLTSLNLAGNKIEVETLSTGNLTGLTSLNLNCNNIGDEGAKALSSGNLTGLTSLDLRTNKIGAEGAKALSKGQFTGLTSLDLSCNNIGDEEAKALSAGNLMGLTSLNLSCNNIGDEEAKALSAGNLMGLTSLDLRTNKIGAEGAKALSKGQFTGLTSLILEKNNIEDEGTKSLLTGNLFSLTSLDLRENNIGDEGAKALSTGNLTGLTSLNLHCNNIGDEGAKALSTGNLTGLTSLSLYGNNKIGDEGCKALSTGQLTSLIQLILGRNNIGDEGAKALSTGNLMGLTSLSLSSNNIGVEGAKALSTANLTNLTSLYLTNSDIGAEGAKALSTANLTNLTSLYLTNSDIGAEGKAAFTNKKDNLKVIF